MRERRVAGEGGVSEECQTKFGEAPRAELDNARWRRSSPTDQHLADGTELSFWPMVSAERRSRRLPALTLLSSPSCAHVLPLNIHLLWIRKSGAKECSQTSCGLQIFDSEGRASMKGTLSLLILCPLSEQIGLSLTCATTLLAMSSCPPQVT